MPTESAERALAPLAASPLTAAPERLGYAFGQPRILAVQHLFGLAHGIALLAAACRELPDVALNEAARQAYHRWRTQQVATVLALQDELARWYFGRDAARADRSDVVRALGLKTQLDRHGEELRAACASLPDALAKPRYDLQRQLRLEEALSQVALGIRAEQTLIQCRERLTGEEREQLRRRFAVWQAANGPYLAQWLELASTLWVDEAQSFAQWQASRSQQEIRSSRRDCLAASAALSSASAMLSAVPLPALLSARSNERSERPADEQAPSGGADGAVEPLAPADTASAQPAERLPAVSTR